MKMFSVCWRWEHFGDIAVLGAKRAERRDEGMISEEWTWDTCAEEKGNLLRKTQGFPHSGSNNRTIPPSFSCIFTNIQNCGLSGTISHQFPTCWVVIGSDIFSSVRNEALGYVLNNARCNGKRSVWLTQGQESNFSFSAYVQPLRILEGLFSPGAISSLSLHFLKKKRSLDEGRQRSGSSPRKSQREQTNWFSKLVGINLPSEARDANMASEYLSESQRSNRGKSFVEEPRH